LRRLIVSVQGLRPGASARRADLRACA